VLKEEKKREQFKGVATWKNVSLIGKRELTYFAKDNFWTKEFFTTASSDFLSDFQPNEDATVIKLLKKKGYICLGKTNLDEFACGGSGLLSNKGILVNPYNHKHIVGGSSSGSAIAVARNLVPFALGSDTGGSVRCPAAYCGIVGFKPSYGLISRYGLIPFASSLDTIGILASRVETTKKIFSILAQRDSRDLLTITKKKRIKVLRGTKKIAIIQGLEENLEESFKELYYRTLSILKKEGYGIKKIKLVKELRENLQLTYLILSCNELLSHLNSLQGITFGAKENSSIFKKRDFFLGQEIKKRLLLGAYFLENLEYLKKAWRFREWAKQWIKEVLTECSFLFFPSMSSSAPKINEVSSAFAGSQIVHWTDNLLLLANFSGIPSLSLPIGIIKKLPVSININAAYGNDQELLEIAELLERKVKFG
jgi:aspartyl-tRNA(Asn)/glutamyl-tRNA(Gln) amidotransferase subunit A